MPPGDQPPPRRRAARSRCRRVDAHQSGPPAAPFAPRLPRGRVAGACKPRRQGAAAPAVAPPPGRAPGASEPRATASRASTCARPRRSPPDPGAAARGLPAVGDRSPGWRASRHPQAPCPRQAGAATEGCFVCAARAGMPRRECSPRPVRKTGKAEPAVEGAEDRKALLHAATSGPAAPHPRSARPPSQTPTPAQPRGCAHLLPATPASWLIVVRRLGGGATRARGSALN